MAAIRSLSLHAPISAPSTASAGLRARSQRAAVSASFSGLRRHSALRSPSQQQQQQGGRFSPALHGAKSRRPATVQANWNQEVVFADAPVIQSEKVAELLYAVTLDISDLPEIRDGYTKPGQFVQVKVGDAKPAFLAIASPPSVARDEGRLEFLIKAAEGSTAAQIAETKAGARVAVSAVMGKGFNADAVSPPGEVPSVLLFATGSGISPIRALIEHGFDASARKDVRLFFGVRNGAFLPYQERFAAWEASGVQVIPVFSDPEDGWTGATGFVQSAYSAATPVADGSKAGAVLCGHKGMAQDVTALLTEQMVPKERILLNF
ncbi:hypothetical protein CLOM_g2322 [Closterium sp. NIES-68]|nr:hypothetical protein CLOM_g2322 [Closterium sp. NIES-68]GJP62751.1 hypothetical protein CLOP_g19773 [Closterium sp. NIES-67]